MGHIPFEDCVLKAIMKDPRILPAIAMCTESVCFQNNGNGLIYNAIIDLAKKNRGEGIDAMLVLEHIEELYGNRHKSKHLKNRVRMIMRARY